MSMTISDNKRKLDSKFFSLLVGCVSIVMMFTAYTSAYIVRQAGGNWLEFDLPKEFTFSTVIIVLSSVALQFSYGFFKSGKALLYRGFLVLAFILGLYFLIMQYQGWLALNVAGITLDGNPSGSFIFVISGVHAAHILGGIACLIVALIHAFSLDYFISEKRTNRFKMVLTYWHFVGLIWIYLFIFFNVQR